jgi:hypothetical protein
MLDTSWYKNVFEEEYTRGYSGLYKVSSGDTITTYSMLMPEIFYPGAKLYDDHLFQRLLAVQKRG